MNRYISSLLCIAFVASVSGCAEAPVADPDLGKSFVPVQAHQTVDLEVSCADIQSRIGDTEDAVVALDKQIKRDSQQSQGFSMMSALAGMTGVLANNPLSAQLSNINVI